MSPTLLSSYAVQAAGALFTAVLFGIFSRTYRKPFLLHWARSWSAMCIMLVGAALGSAIATSGPPTSFTRFTISAATAVAAYMSVAWLLLGALEIASPQRAVRLQPRRYWLFVAAGIVGIGTTLLYANHPEPLGPRFFARVGGRSAVIGIAFLAAAIAVWMTRHQEPRRSLGRALVGGALALYGATQLQMVWAIVFTASRGREPSYTLYIGFLDFILVFTVGLGVVIWLLEEQHGRAATTANEIAQLAFHDPLTGLQNRKLFLDHLTLAIVQARRDREKLAVFFLDLDRFKVINDSLGHAAGDKVLQGVSSSVKDLMREGDAVARMGGDEFVILTPEIHGVADAVHIAQKIRDSIRVAMHIDGREIFVSASMGIAIYPDDGEDAETLLKNADTAMYRAKSQGSDMFQLYTPEMNAHAVEQLALESALRRAVETREFELHYQPIVQTTDNKICTMEMMLRWRHPVLGLVRPEQFIKLAETSGLIVPIGEWAMKVACEQLSEWRKMGHPDLRLAINISARQLKQLDFVDRVRVVLAECALPGSALEFEITEMSATQSEPVVVERLRAIRSMGIRISIDDFGTGFSSVSVLRVFPVDALKIDTSFVRDLMLDPNDAAIAAAVIALAKSMGLTVIAEGVENPAQLDFLRLQGCEMWQGYLCCPPVPTTEVRSVLGRRSGGLVRKKVNTPGDIEVIKH
ncbi:MAG TPA: EAL domain-containing protein [Gemmatimonadaceae bacterium]|nr:EAL domain-containing protein [Gemmatimonadaceae bacterium]